MGLYDDGDEFNKYVVRPCLSRSYFMVFNSQTRKGNNSLGSRYFSTCEISQLF